MSSSAVCDPALLWESGSIAGTVSSRLCIKFACLLLGIAIPEVRAFHSSDIFDTVAKPTYSPICQNGLPLQSHLIE